MKNYPDNFRVVNGSLFRGAKPAMKQLMCLSSVGVRSVVDLEIFNVWEWLLAGNMGLKYRHISCKPWHPEREDANAFLAWVQDPANQPVYVHCRQGADRTGMMCAIYRIQDQGWSKADAIREMIDGGFGFHGATWTEIVPFVEAW